jgi:phosphate/sulfate permease
MNEIYLILVVVLFALAISDLIVGVSNDAVNFLNSAIGSKAASKWMIFGVAGLGILLGSAFSSGMMEVARKGIFHPEMFNFAEIMIIFLAVMITDVILLDVFNTFGFPTSTTVSLVFELLGSAVAVSVVKMSRLNESASELGKYINTDKALAIIVGILTSVVIAFTVGTIIQWITRVIFSFRYEKRLKYFGSIYGGIAIAIVTYFLIIKGAKDAVFITEDTLNWLMSNILTIVFLSMIGWAILLQILKWLFDIDILKIIVLVGTGALAMAFAANDLVNFIGVPLAGFSSFEIWKGSGVEPGSFTMELLGGKVKTPSYMLIVAGAIMFLTLVTSKKAQAVVRTSVDLSRQNEGNERFGSSIFSRMVVKASIKANKSLVKVMPSSIHSFISRQFEPAPVDDTIELKDRPAFDKLRAANGLIISSILISLGTSLKLPLSTTYVTFMVAMGTSLADRAWGRESAVYRISGVFAVIGGWFLTAIVAFIVSFIFAQIFAWGGFIAILFMSLIAILIIVRTQILFRKREKAQIAIPDEDEIVDQNTNTQKVLEKCNKNTVKAVISTSKAYYLCFEGFFSEDKQELKNALTEARLFNEKAKKRKDNLYKNIQRLNQDSVETGHFYVQIVDYQREMAHSLNFLIEPVYTHFMNQHKPFTQLQINRLREFNVGLNGFFNHVLHVLKEGKFEKLDELIELRDNLLANLRALEKEQIKRIKNDEVSTRNSVLYFNIITETKNILLQLINVVKAQRDFMVQTHLKIG